MARPLRLEFPGALYHVTSRGDRRDDIYENDADRVAFLTLLGNVCDTHHWVCHAYCLMDNHYHLLVETPDANLSKGMRQLNGVYTQNLNRAHHRVGHVFQGRYKAIHVEKQRYLLELARYIVLNPVRARMVRTARDWPWSSYRATICEVKQAQWLNTEWLLASFAKTKRTAVKRYQQFIVEGENQPSPWSEIKNQVFLGEQEFVDELRGYLDEDKAISEIPRSQRRCKPLSLDEYDTKSKTRDEAIAQSYASGGYTQKEIGDYYGLHYSRVSRIINKTKRKT